MEHKGVGPIISVIFKFISSYWRPYRAKCALLMFCMMITLAFETLVPLSFKFLIDDAITPKNFRLLTIILVTLVSGAILSTLASWFRDYLYVRVAASVLNDLRIRVFSHLQQLSIGFYNRNRVGDIMARFTTDMSSVEQGIIQALPGGIMSFLGLIVTVVFLFILQWKLALLSIIGLPLCMVGPRLLGSRASAASYAYKDEQARVSNTVQENIVSQSVVKAFGLQQPFVDNFKKQMESYFKISVKANFLSFLMERTPNMGVLVFHLLVICVGSVLVFRDLLSIGSLVTFNALFLNLSQAVYGITWVIPELIQASAGIQRINGILAEKPEIIDTEDAVESPRPTREIAFRDVTFGYTDNNINLNNVNITIPHGWSAAFVGSSGSGKSTIINIIIRFYDPISGSVTIDGVDLRHVTQQSLRSHIGIVLQDSILFNSSIYENIRMGNPGAGEEEVWKAAKAAAIHELILSLPQGYNTPVGERGSLLSGGQRQRVAIARALIRNPSILILDEATSALDPVSEAEITETIKHVSAGRTVLSVTHRLSTAYHCDRIFVLDRGQVVEQGNHEELVQLNGFYKQLWEKQRGFTINYDNTHAEVTVDRLKLFPIFNNLDTEVLSMMKSHFVSEYYSQGQVIVYENDPGNKFYIIVRGKVEVIKDIDGENEQRINVLQDGDYFGELALLQNTPRQASVRTLQQTLVLSLHRNSFDKLIENAPQVRAILHEKASQYTDRS